MSGGITFSLSFRAYEKTKELRAKALKHPIEETKWAIARDVGVRLLFEAGFAVIAAALVESAIQAFGGLITISLSFIPLGAFWDNLCIICFDHLALGTVHSGFTVLTSNTAIFFQIWDTTNFEYMTRFEAYA